MEFLQSRKMEGCINFLIFLVILLVIAAIIWIVLRDYITKQPQSTQPSDVTPVTPVAGVTLTDASLRSQGTSESPFIILPGVTTLQKEDRKLAKHPCEYTFDAPSPVGGLPGSEFLQCNAEARKRGGTGQIIASSADLNNSSTIWRLTIKEGGCWQAPFHAHAIEEFWFVSKGDWTYRWYDPTGPKTDLNGHPIVMENNHPSGPNKQIILRECGSTIIFKRGTFFEWGSNTSGAQVTVWFPGTIMDGSIQEMSILVNDYNNGRIKQEDLSRILGDFQQRYETSFVL